MVHSEDSTCLELNLGFAQVSPKSQRRSVEERDDLDQATTVQVSLVIQAAQLESVARHPALGP